MQTVEEIASSEEFRSLVNDYRDVGHIQGARPKEQGNEETGINVYGACRGRNLRGCAHSVGGDIGSLIPQIARLNSSERKC